jgi:hypothetical protein
MVAGSNLRRVMLTTLVLLIGLTFLPAVKASTILDIFPAALPNYAYGGWQGPFGDGTAGRLFATADGSGIYADATYNGLVWALRSAPEFPSIDMTIHFSIPNRDFTVADYFALLLLFHTPTTPPSTPPGTNCDGTCSYVTAQSGFKIFYRMGFGQLIVANSMANATLAQVPLPAISVNQPHDARALYVPGSLSVYLDGTLLVSLQTDKIVPGQVGFETYRTDLIVNTISLTTPQPQRLLISLTGGFDYLLQETVPAQVAALVTDASTGQPISNANVTIQIVDTSGNTIVPTVAIREGVPGTGVYIWTSNSTLQRLHLPKGIYLATVTASFPGSPIAHAILSFHVDPPVNAAPQPIAELTWIMAITAVVASAATIILSLGLLRIRRSRLGPESLFAHPSRHN